MAVTAGSQNLRIFRIAIRDGASVEDAAEQAGMSLGEARLTIAEDAKNPPPPEAYVLLRVTDPEAAGCAVTNEGELVMPDENDNDLPVVDLATDTLRGDVRDAFLSWFKATPKPWSAMNEQEQREFADTADRAARTLVRDACKLIAAKERPVIVAHLEQYQEKDGIKATLKLPATGEAVLAMHEACGREVLIVTSGYDEVSGEAGEAEIDADQPNFPQLGEEYDEAA